MKLTCDRSALVDKLAILARGVSTRSALPVLSGIMLQAADGRLDLYSTDMELSIKASLSTTIEHAGEIVVPARLFTDVVRNLPEDLVIIEASEATVAVTAGRAGFSLNAWSASDFPQTSTFDTSGAFAIGAEPFVETLTKVGRAASRDYTRPILTGVLMTIQGDTLRMVATDSYRLAVKESKLETALEAEVQAIVPVKALGEVARLAGGMPGGNLEVARRPCRRRVDRLAASRRAIPELQAALAGSVRP
jgi:DNA polymerase-3 subunit beta